MLEGVIHIVQYTVVVGVLGALVGFAFTKCTMYSTPFVILGTVVAPMAGFGEEWNDKVLGEIASMPSTAGSHFVDYGEGVHADAMAYGGVEGMVFVLISVWFVLVFGIAFFLGVLAGLVVPLLSLFF